MSGLTPLAQISSAGLAERHASQRQIRTVAPRTPLHKNTVGMLALGPITPITKDGQAANYEL